MKVMKKKGFTTIELLVTIVILGLLTTLISTVFLGILDRSHNEYYRSQENMLVLAARDYYADHRSELPKEVGEISSVTVDTLIEQEYIDEIKDRNEENCNFRDSAVFVQKVTNRDYQYYSELKCDNDDYKTDTDKTAPVITFSPNSSSSTKNITVKMKVTDNKKVSSYRYVITKNDTVIKDTGYQTYQNELTIKLTEKGVYTITGYAYDASGNSSVKTSGIYSIYDTINCGNVKFSSNVKTATWTNKDVRITVNVTNNTFKWEANLKIDNANYSLLKTVVGPGKDTITLTTDGKNKLKVKLYDAENDECEISTGEYYIDKTPPTVPVISNPTNGEFTTKNFKLTVSSKDERSGIKHYQYSYDNKKWTTYANSAKETFVTTEFSKERNQAVYIRACDNAGNCSDSASTMIRIDKTKPTCGKITGASTSWTENDRYITVECKDSGSGCKYNPYSKNINFTAKTYTFTIEDNAGNTNSCVANAYVDKDKPTVPTATLRYDSSTGPIKQNNENWTGRSVWWGDFKSTSKTSKIDHYEYSLDCTGQKTKNLNKSYLFSPTRNQDFCIRAVTESGRTSDWSKPYYFRIDKTDPVVKLSVENGFIGEAQLQENGWGKTYSDINLTPPTITYSYYDAHSGSDSETLSVSCTGKDNLGHPYNLSYSHNDKNNTIKINIDTSSAIVVTATCTVSVTDKVGNTGSKSVTLKIGNGWYKEGTKYICGQPPEYKYPDNCYPDYYWYYYNRGSKVTGWKQAYWYNPSKPEGAIRWYYFYDGTEKADKNGSSGPKTLLATGWVQNVGGYSGWYYLYEPGGRADQTLKQWHATGVMFENVTFKLYNAGSGIWETFTVNSSGRCTSGRGCY